MNRKSTVFLVAGVVLASFLGLGVAVYYKFSPVLIGEPDIRQSGKPLTLEEARGHCPIELPEGAQKIQFAEYSLFIAYECIVRFESPVGIAKLHAKKLLEAHNRKQEVRSGSSSELVDLKEAPDPQEFDQSLNVNWFDVENIKNGSYGGETGSHRPQIWIDQDRGIFYYLYTD